MAALGPPNGRQLVLPRKPRLPLLTGKLGYKPVKRALDNDAKPQKLVSPQQQLSKRFLGPLEREQLVLV